MPKIKFQEEKDAIDELKKKYQLKKDNIVVNGEGHVIHLNLLNRGITKVEGLDALSQLQILNLNDNQITKIEGLDALSKLQELYLGGNKITKIEGLDLDNAQAVVKYCKEAIKKV